MPARGAFVPWRAPGVVAVPAEHEAVLFQEADAELHLLNAPGALVWGLCDGVASVARIAAEIAEELDAPYERVLPDTLDVVDDLRSTDLVRAGPAPRAEPVDAVETAPPARVRVDAAVLLGPGGALVVNDTARVASIDEEALAHSGWSRPPRDETVVDTATLEVEVGAGAGAVRHPIRAVLLLGAHPDHLKVASASRRLASMAALLPHDGTARAEDLAALSRLEDGCQVIRMLGLDLDALTDQLAARPGSPTTE